MSDLLSLITVSGWSSIMLPLRAHQNPPDFIRDNSVLSSSDTAYRASQCAVFGVLSHVAPSCLDSTVAVCPPYPPSEWSYWSLFWPHLIHSDFCSVKVWALWEPYSKNATFDSVRDKAEPFKCLICTLQSDIIRPAQIWKRVLAVVILFGVLLSRPLL